jgi:cell shape-determining protein MreC
VESADRSKAIDELQQRAQAAAAEIRKVVDDRVESFSKRFKWAEEIEKLRTEVEQLRAKVDELDKPKKSPRATGRSAGGKKTS